MKKLDYIDALRGLAILAVIMVHANKYGNIHLAGFFGAVVDQGNKGVQLFYLASAFTLFLSFSSRGKKEISPVRNFFIRRFFRIAPMYYIGICYYLFQDGFGPRYWLGDQTHITSLNILSNFTFLHGFNPYWFNSVVPGGWSIGVEMTFYLVLPFLFSKIKNIRQAFNLFLASLALQWLLQIILSKFPFINSPLLWDEYLSLYFPAQLPIFSLGIIMYFIISKNESLRSISITGYAALGILVLAQFFSGKAVFLIGHTLYGISFLLLGVFLSKVRFRLIVNPVITYIGKISFSMYLVHFAVLYWLSFAGSIDYCKNPALNYIVKFSIVAAIAAAISTVFYKVIEIPFQHFGKSIISKMEKRDAQAVLVLHHEKEDG